MKEELILKRGDEMWSFPLTKLVYARPERLRLQLRFPLHRIDLQLAPRSRMMPVNLPTTESRELLQGILDGLISVVSACTDQESPRWEEGLVAQIQVEQVYEEYSEKEPS